MWGSFPPERGVPPEGDLCVSLDLSTRESTRHALIIPVMSAIEVATPIDEQPHSLIQEMRQTCKFCAPLSEKSGHVANQPATKSGHMATLDNYLDTDPLCVCDHHGASVSSRDAHQSPHR